jgi:hypothetical protein
MSMERVNPPSLTLLRDKGNRTLVLMLRRGELHLLGVAFIASNSSQRA